MKMPIKWERGPFEDCWKCKEKGTFGILSIGGDSVTKRCMKCRYSHAELLPKLDKKVIYLDQFAFSELHKLRAGTRREDKWTPFWSEVDRLLHQAVLLQQVVLPHSDIHHRETIVSPFARALRETQDSIGGDIDFVSTYEIQLIQIEDYVRAYFEGNEPNVEFNVDNVLQGERNHWLPDIRIVVGMDWSSFAPETREGRESTHSEISKMIEGWKKSEIGFDEVVERELGAYLSSRRQALLYAFSRLEEAIKNEDYISIFNYSHSFVFRELDIVHNYANKAGVRDDDFAAVTNGFLGWPKNRDQPFGRLLAYLFAALAAQFKGGRTRLPSPGLLNDLTAISAYAPYVDAMFVDNECAELLRHGRCRKDLEYKAAIFSLNDANAYIAFLQGIIERTPNDVRQHAVELYGLK
jgi:hypothetical protein